MDPTSKPVIMLGYCDNQKGYRLWSSNDKKVITASNVEFFEEQMTDAEAKRICLPVGGKEFSDVVPDEILDMPVAEQLSVEEPLPVNSSISVDVHKKRTIKRNLTSNGVQDADEPL